MAKRKRKMSDEQRKAAGERLAAARAKRLKENPPQYKNIHPIARDRPEDDPFHFRKVQGWIKVQKELLADARRSLRLKEKNAISKVASIQGYIANLQKYLSTGEYVDLFYGDKQQHRIKYTDFKPGFDKDGNVKRSFGVFYPDLGYSYRGIDRHGNDLVKKEE